MRPPTSRRSRGALAALALFVLASFDTAPAMTILPLDLGQLTGEAGRIFVGRVEQVQSGHDANGLPAVWTTFAVDESLKGQTSGHVTLKELGTSFGGSGARVVPHIGIPRYRPGEAVMLFVHSESALGFTSPVGLGQGCFRIRDHEGRRIAENDVGNRNLAAQVAAAQTLGRAGRADAPAAEGLPLETLLGQVRALVDAAP